MKIARLAGLVFMALVAVCLIAASAASAKGENPLFTPVSQQLVSGTSGLTLLTSDNGVERLTCEKSTLDGKVVSALLVGNLVVHYLECRSAGTKEVGKTCPVKSIESPGEGLIITNTLHGILGLILPSKETGVLLLPQTGSEFFSLAANNCTTETTLSGNVAGLLTPVGTSVTEGKVILAANGNFQSILDIDLTHALGLVAPKLNSFSTTATFTETASVTYSVATEVT